MKAKLVNEYLYLPSNRMGGSPDPTKMPIIGKIITKDMKWGDYEFPSEEMMVVGKYGDDIYVINKWNEPGVPQLVHQDMVERYIEFDKPIDPES